MPALDTTDAQLIARLATDFPLSATPYADVAAELGLGEAQVLARLRRLHDLGVIGAPVPQVPHATGGSRRSALIGAQVPGDEVDAVAARVCTLPSVVHAEQRRHRYNLWFALVAESALALDAACAQAAARIGAPLLVLPHEISYAGTLLWLL
ncbi:Lrp/AsnC family transcriptional regulator [Azohydromonas sp.]|uniref:Lrp/AsnC family transcriptional regulator n=1 Tax=Azohydromonas sp. TaxID=1872666 RepID=UPI002C61CF8E|nr:Lrp/AsnC family transcriptional regulator [Azohydromonas sp.]HMM86532.1 Lrp/AsnC family transcriptional regulator [Azohydromonas sp.]